MASFETIVRPVVVPNIRPAPSRLFSGAGGSLLTITTPGEGFAVIHGNPAKQVNLSNSSSITITRSQAQEQKRRVDTVRVSQKLDDGTINSDNFVDIDVTNKIWLQDYNGSLIRYYRRAKEADNIKIKERNKILRNEELTGGPENPFNPG